MSPYTIGGHGRRREVLCPKGTRAEEGGGGLSERQKLVQERYGLTDMSTDREDPIGDSVFIYGFDSRLEGGSK